VSPQLERAITLLCRHSMVSKSCFQYTSAAAATILTVMFASAELKKAIAFESEKCYYPNIGRGEAQSMLRDKPLGTVLLHSCTMTGH